MIPIGYVYVNSEGHRCFQFRQGLMDLDHWTETPVYEGYSEERKASPEALTPTVLASLFQEADPDAYVEEMEPGLYVIDGRFYLNRLAELFSRRINTREARNQALEDAAQEADKWFPANSAAKYPSGGIAAAIRAMKS